MDRQTDLDILAGTEVFRGLAPAALDEVRAAAFRKRVAKGAALFHQGDPVTTFYVVVVGRLKATQMGADTQQIITRYLGPGEMAGYAAVCGGDVYYGTVTALDDSHLLAWTREAIHLLMARHAQIAMNALSVVGGRYQETQVRLRELATEKVERRVAHTLLRLVRQAGRRTADGVEIAFPLSRQDLAEMSGTTLHTVSRTLSGWEAQGIVDSGRRRVVVRKPHDLVMIAEE
jgi:CRP-like cAMP-binding protein